MIKSIIRNKVLLLIFTGCIASILLFTTFETRAKDILQGTSIQTSKTVFKMNDEEGIRLGTHSGMAIRIKSDGGEVWIVDPALDIYIVVSSKNKHITLTMGNSGIELKKGSVNIWSDGDININSGKGNVKINGKKILLNE